MATTEKPKLLYFDVEWSPTLAYTFVAWDANISPQQVVEDGGLLCVCWKLDSGPYEFRSAWEDGKEKMISDLAAAIAEADAVISYNGDKFDLPKVQGELLRLGLPPLPPVTSIDLIKSVKKLGYFRNALGYVAPFLGLGKKLKHEGFNLWREVLEGDAQAQKKMKRYNIQDVRLLVNMYKKLRPFVKNHPHLGFTKPEACPTCGGTHVQKRGVTRTRSFITQRLNCQTCGSWFSGKRSKAV